MMPSLEAMANGLSATAIIVTGYVIGTRLLMETRRTTSKLLGWQALFAICLGSFYLGTVASFWMLVFLDQNIQPPELGAILCYTVAPVGIATVMYIGFSMIKPNLAKPISIIYMISAIPFWMNLWFDWPEKSKMVVLTGPAELIDIELLSWTNILTAVYILSMILVLGTGFLMLAKQTTGQVRKRSIYYATGIIMFSIGGIIDSRFPLGIWMVLVRLFMVAAYLVLYKAMIPPKASFPPIPYEARPMKEI
ncbi:MAG: hypothetical protein GYA24_02395 [Candidatus Lokiarchaeota archaeon]|nr:hypothetical protein [Candidatus Lokiarchaeota archaeon]